jgi:DNA repair photolyase
MITNPIYKPKGRALEYGALACNIYNGCNHGCTYCFARKMSERYTPQGKPCAFDEPKLREGIVEAVVHQLNRGKIKNETIHLCFSCDPYPVLVDTSATREVIKAIKDSGNHVQLLTKAGSRAMRDIDLLDGDDWFGVTISGFDITAEPNAEPPEERLTSLEIAKLLGVKTWVSCEPVLFEEDIYNLIERANYIDLFKIGKLNYEPSDINWGEFGRKCEWLCKLYSRKYYIKEDLRNEMEKGGTTQ